MWLEYTFNFKKIHKSWTMEKLFGFGEFLDSWGTWYWVLTNIKCNLIFDWVAWCCWELFWHFLSELFENIIIIKENFWFGNENTLCYSSHCHYFNDVKFKWSQTCSDLSDRILKSLKLNLGSATWDFWESLP